MSDPARVKVVVSGHVQSVGFRWWTTRQAQELGIVGHAVNLPNGDVEVLAQGTPDAVDELVGRLRTPRSEHGRPGRVAGVSVTEQEPDSQLRGFTQG